MPGQGQTSVTLPNWVWELVKEQYQKHKEELADKGIKSPTALVKLWIIEKSRQ